MRIAVPVDQIQGLNFTKTQRRIDVIKPDGNQDAAPFGLRCFIVHKIAGSPRAVVRPDDHDAFRRIKRSLYLRAPAFTSDQMTIPPDGISGILPYRREPGNPDFVLALVGNENVGHG